MTLTNVLLSFSGFMRCLPRQMLFVCKHVIVLRWKSARFGSHLLVFFVLCLQVLIIRVGVLCCFGRLSLSLLFVLGLMIMAVLFSVSSVIVETLSVSRACMHQIVTQSVRSFFDDVCERINPSVSTVLCGDFNAVFDRLLEYLGSHPHDTVRESSIALVHLFSSCCVTDI